MVRGSTSPIITGKFSPKVMICDSHIMWMTSLRKSPLTSCRVRLLWPLAACFADDKILPGTCLKKGQN